MKRHGMSGARIYKLWSEMRARCEKADHEAWPDYGGRGIRVCSQWAQFDRFYEDFGRLRPSDAHTIDRIDNDGNYEPGNVRWATRVEQGRNKRNNVRYEAFGAAKTFAEWAEDPRCAVGADTVKCRLYRGWPVERAITEPPVPGPAWKHPVEKHCTICGASFVPHPTKRQRQQTCSAICANESRSRSHRLLREEVTALRRVLKGGA